MWARPFRWEGAYSTKRGIIGSCVVNCRKHDIQEICSQFVHSRSYGTERDHHHSNWHRNLVFIADIAAAFVLFFQNALLNKNISNATTAIDRVLRPALSSRITNGHLFSCPAVERCGGISLQPADKGLYVQKYPN